MKAIIIDDERKATLVLSKLLQAHCDDIKVVATANNSSDARILISEHSPDIIFLDAELAHETGFDVLKEFPCGTFKTIFVTAHSHYAIKAIKYGVHDYLMKPVMLDELLESIGRLKPTLREKEFPQLLFSPNHHYEVLTVPASDGHVVLRQTEIVRLKGDGAYTHIFNSKGQHYTASYNLAHFERQLDPDIFLRCHKSHIINMERVQKILRAGGYAVELTDGEKVDVSKTFRPGFDEKMRARTSHFG